MDRARPVDRIIEPQVVIEGAGVRLRRSIAPHSSNLYDPFLLFDHFAFNDPREGTNPGFPMHPHRGIETVTYMLEGVVKHRDSLGNSGTIQEGDVQWMTSGRGILHEEMPRRGPTGNIYGFQLWVNLPAALKMGQPRYQEVNAQSIPTSPIPGGKARVVAGNVHGVQGPVTEIAVQPVYLEVQLDANAEFVQPISEGHTALAYVFEGSGDFAGQQVAATRMLVFGDGDHVRITAGDEGLRFMLIAGAPIREPIVPYGPFVMNTVEEIQQTLQDLRNGTFVQPV